MKLILESWRKVQEQQEQQATPQELAVASDTLEKASDEIENFIASLVPKVQQTQKAQKKPEGEVNEVFGIALAASITAVIPLLMKGIAMIVRRTKDDVPGHLFAKMIDERAEQLEKLFLIPFIPLAKAFVMASGTLDKLPEAERPQALEEKSHKIAETMFIIAVAMMATLSGVGAIKALKGSNLVYGTFETVLSAVKSGEVGAFLGKSIEAILGGGQVAAAASSATA